MIVCKFGGTSVADAAARSEEHTSELQSLTNLVCRLLLEKKQDTPAPHSGTRGYSPLCWRPWGCRSQPPGRGSHLHRCASDTGFFFSLAWRPKTPPLFPSASLSG